MAGIDEGDGRFMRWDVFVGGDKYSSNMLLEPLSVCIIVFGSFPGANQSLQKRRWDFLVGEPIVRPL